LGLEQNDVDPFSLLLLAQSAVSAIRSGNLKGFDMATYLQTSGAIAMSQINSVFGRGNSLSNYQGTTYYTAGGGPYSFPGGAISFSNFYGTGPSPNITISLSELQGREFYQSTIGDSYINLTFNTDGTWGCGGSYAGYLGSGNWASPTTASIGNSYWIRWTRTEAVLDGGESTPSSGWLAMSAANTITVIHNVAVGGYVDSTYTLEIASDSGGSNVVASCTGTYINVFNEG
jgi:hypothetical protein